jgi:hypothetical protein
MINMANAWVVHSQIRSFLGARKREAKKAVDRHWTGMHVG